MSNALHDYAKLFEKYAANNGGTGAILAGKDCLSIANEMRMDADAIDAENAKLRGVVASLADRSFRMADKMNLLQSENAKLRELCETFGMIANDAVCVYYECDEMLAQANADARKLGVEL